MNPNKRSIQDKPKVISKLYRLQLSDEIRTFIRAIPVKKLTEVTKGNHVYLAHGLIRWNSADVPVRLRVWLRKKELYVAIRSPQTKVTITCAFTTPADREAAPSIVKNLLEK